jgi:hypothetical protein
MTRITSLFAAAASVFAFSAAATPAAAVVNLVDPIPCDIFSTGCRFEVDGGNTFSQISAIIAEYNLELDPDLVDDLVFLGKTEGNDIEDANGNDVGDVTFNGNTVTFNSLPFGTTPNYFLLKAANDVILFARDPTVFPLTLTNTLITNQNGSPQGISHIDFFYSDDLGSGTGVIPEPGTWALMIMGFGGAGAMLRRRRLAVA